VAFGLPASYTEEFDDLGSEADVREWVKQAIESLGWSIRKESPRTITASTGMNWSSYGERLTIQFHPDGRLSVTSKCVFFAQLFDWGKNEANVRELISAVKSCRPRRSTRATSQGPLPIVVTCASCATRIKAPDSAAGKKVKCPKCATPVPVPAPDVEPLDEPDERGAEKQIERGRHQEDEDERPARGRRPNSPRVGGRKEVSALGVVSLVIGGLGFLFSLIPCVGLFALPWVGIGLLCGIAGFFVARSRPNTGVGLPIAGTVVCLTAALISVGWVAGFHYLVKRDEAKRLKEEQALREGPAIAVTAVHLFEQYRSDEAGADSKYKDKVLALSGTVVQVTGEGTNAHILELKTDEDDHTIDCNFYFAHKEELAKLVPGQQVTVRGTCKGIVLGSVTLEKCILAHGPQSSPDEPGGGVAKVEERKMPEAPRPDWSHLDISHAKVQDEFLRINRWEAISTKRPYSGPIEVTVVARTEKENIRLHAFKGAAVIFNWEVRISMSCASRARMGLTSGRAGAWRPLRCSHLLPTPGTPCAGGLPGTGWRSG
jgi:hypothetical protein